MHCPECGCLNGAYRKNCFNCNAPLDSNAATPISKPEITPPPESGGPTLILSRSVSSKSAAEAWRDSIRKFASRIQWVGIFVVLGYFALAAFCTYSDNRDLKEIADWLFHASWLWIILLIVMVFLFIAGRKLHQATDSEIAPYLACCNTEFLIVDTEKIHGNTRKGGITLYYHQIQSVSCVVSSLAVQNQNAETFSYYKLIVTDVANNRFEFLSFSNAVELCTLIKSRLPQRRSV